MKIKNAYQLVLAFTLSISSSYGFADVSYIAPTKQDLKGFQSTVNDILKGQPVKRSDTQSLKYFSIKPISNQKKNIILIFDNNQPKMGGGYFLINTQSALPILLQAPHSDTDLLTGKITRKIFNRSNIKAAAFNTVPRRFYQNNVLVNADLAHTKTSYFETFTEQFIKLYPSSTVIQLHGFANSSRKSYPGKSADMVVSNGTSIPNKKTTSLASCLSQQLKLNVMVYPTDIHDLGATQNTQGNYINLSNPGHFLHIEMNKRTRQFLAHNTTAINRFTTCLLSVVND